MTMTVGAAPQRKRRDRTAVWSVILIIAVFAGLAARVLGFELRLDEQLYIPPAELLRESELYTGFFYNHVPLSAYYFYVLNLALGGEHLVLAARLGIVLGWVVMLSSVWAASLAISRSRLVALFCVLALETNILLLTVPGMTATNNFLQLVPAYAGLALFVLAVLHGKERPVKAFFSGLCLSIAVGVKVSAIVFVPALAVAAFLLPSGITVGRRMLLMTLPMAAGGLLGAAPLFWLLLHEPTTFLAHVIDYHSGPHVAYWTEARLSEPGVAFGLADKAQLAQSVWLQSTNLLLLVTLILLAVHAVWAEREGEIVRSRTYGSVVALAAVAVMAAALSFLPTPSFEQYYVLPLPVLVLAVPLLWRALPDRRRVHSTPVLVVLAGMMVFLALPRLGEATARVATGEPPTHAKVEHAGGMIRRAMGDSRGPVATLAPIYPLEAGLEVYPQFATGLFAYRVVPMSEADQLEHYLVTGPEQLPELLDERPPAAILTGFHDELEAPFVDWAQANSYSPAPDVDFTDRYGRAMLWLPPR